MTRPLPSRSGLGPLAKTTCEQLGWCPKQVVAVTPDVSAIEAMALMNEKHISAVAVVDSVGKIIATRRREALTSTNSPHLFAPRKPPDPPPHGARAARPHARRRRRRRRRRAAPGNFSVSEMRTIMAEHFGALALPVGEFLALEHGTEFVGYRRITHDRVMPTLSLTHARPP
ncbi:hypothetical protein MNEG_16571 [Monoraphidium neglectum]|uniref:CBS domain-containing protein n=1 Tax=Monoraphidium neglectum TaxID=145388 RepID=A0A0D2K5E5_9CHLO|nr:hypothetical protein MNEG_16571 [Monoraphidium neglectum]KIY91393.1 hypothetical protein MNEG_16571 [Monoraphidium neglectum]|eukprot:XP_013890413.1 hypothetical protein MNEG_16571 [Monoraphidium neglectum]